MDSFFRKKTNSVIEIGFYGWTINNKDFLYPLV